MLRLKILISKILKIKALLFINNLLHLIFSQEGRKAVLNSPNERLVIYFNNFSDNTIFYIIKIDDMSGFFSVHNQLVRYIYFAEKFNFQPVIYINNFSFDDIDFRKKNNLNNPITLFYDYKYISEEIIVNKNYVYFDKYHLNIIQNDFYDVYSHSILTIMSKIAKKYLSPSIYVINKTKNTPIFNVVKSSSAILGVHVRGTDFNYNLKGHPKPVSFKSYKYYIDLFLNKYKIEKIFVATDDENAINYFKDIYGHKIIYFRDNFRSTNFDNPFYTPNRRVNNNLLNGIEVFRDVLTLLECDYFIGSQSNVSYATIMRAHDKNFFKDSQIIFTEKNKQGNYLGVKSTLYRRFYYEKKEKK